MDIIRAYAVKNLCYIRARKMVPKGIVVHSTGANNPNLKRYVDCEAEVGKNTSGNHWNTATPENHKVCVHAFIGYDKNKQVRVAEILPLDICCWGVGNGSKGSFNYDPPHIQFEICEDGLNDERYYRKAFSLAAEYCAYLCKQFGLSEQQIVSHKEAHTLGYGCNHGDPEHWMKNFGENMDDFRSRVADLLRADVENTSITVDRIHVGDLVSIADDAVYYTGKSIPDWVKRQHWYVSEISDNDRVIINENQDYTNAINSPVSRKYLSVVTSKAQVETPASKNFNPYLVRITAKSLNIRKGAGTNAEKIGCITDHGVYTIVEEKQGCGASLWGKLKSGAGWISLDHAKKL